MTMKYRIFLAAAVFPAAYLTGAFVAADWDITAWDGFGRYLIAMLAWAGVVMLLTFP